MGGPVGYWIAYREAAPGDYEQSAWLTGLGWLGVAGLLAALGWRFPRIVGWLLIAVSPLLIADHLFTYAFNSAWMEEWNNTNWSFSVFLAAAGTPLVAGVLFILSARSPDSSSASIESHP